MSRVVVRHSDAFGRHAIDSWSPDDFLAKATEVTVTKIVSHDVNNVRPLVSSHGPPEAANCRQEKQSAHSEESAHGNVGSV